MLIDLQITFKIERKEKRKEVIEHESLIGFVQEQEEEDEDTTTD